MRTSAATSTRRRASAILGLLGLLVLCCDASVPGSATGARCSLTSECATPLVCGFARCRPQCNTSRDCGAGLCVRGERGGTNVCQLENEGACAYDSECPGKQVCGSDLRCRDACRTNQDCVTELVCSAGVCAKPQELVEGKLPSKTPDTRAFCTRSAECTGSLVCRKGVCALECLGDKDCELGWTCSPAASGGNGRCSPATEPVGGTGVLKGLALGAFHSCAAFASGKVKCWGSNEQGQLGLGYPDLVGEAPGEMGDALPFVNLGTGTVASTIVRGLVQSCAISTTGKMKCWGSNDYGELGLGDANSRGLIPGDMGDALSFVDFGAGRTVKSASLGFHGCAILDNDRLKCWGANESGQLGQGDNRRRGGAPGEMGDNLPYVDLGVGRTVKSISNGYLYSCAILDNDGLKCWGWNGFGRLGIGSPQESFGSAPGQMGDALPFVNLGTGRSAKQVVAAFNHGCAVLDNGGLKCWGENNYGQLGVGDALDRGMSPAQMGDGLPYVSLGTGRTAKAVATGLNFTCAVLDNDKVKCWGINESGELGLEDTNERGVAPSDMGDSLPYVNLGTGRTAKAIAAGLSHACAILDNDELKCWGGFVGYEKAVPTGDKPGDMGDNLPYVKLGTR